jgi:hypothetical protein
MRRAPTGRPACPPLALIEADVQRPPMREGEVSTRDPAAGFTRKGQRSFFGDKAHLAVDQGTGDCQEFRVGRA